MLRLRHRALVSDLDRNITASSDLPASRFHIGTTLRSHMARPPNRRPCKDRVFAVVVVPESLAMHAGLPCSITGCSMYFSPMKHNCNKGTMWHSMLYGRYTQTLLRIELRVSYVAAVSDLICDFRGRCRPRYRESRVTLLSTRIYIYIYIYTATHE